MTSPKIPDLGSRLHVHVIGAGGAGMNAIAAVLAAMGHTVTGSDLKDSIGVERLRSLGARVAIGHDAANLHQLDSTPDFVARSTAVPDHNPEVVESVSLGVPVLHRAEILAAIAGQKRTIAVAGTHGKTTTSSMLSLSLVNAGLNPSFIVGGDVNEIGSGAVWDQTGEWFAVEADESDGTFLRLGAEAVVVTNVEADHLDYYGDFATLEQAFLDFVSAASGPKILCGDDDGVQRLISRLAGLPTGLDGVATYGLNVASTYRIGSLSSARDGARFSITCSAGTFAIDLPIPGLHNALNATAAFAASVELGAAPADVVAALSRFAGVARRFEFRGEVAGATLVDDYAHLPTEVAAAIAAGNDGGWNRVVAVFQPHRYSRTAELWQDFADAFGAADIVLLTSIYSAGESPRPGITGDLLAQAVTEAHPSASVTYLPSRVDLRDHLLDILRPGDLCLTMGAGDLTSLPDELLLAATETDSGIVA
ncbi:MAG: UDP-N-acetylmuramate--alanine ligase [Candidatus Poriferisodalaceae bacterium]|jgi:UDP-N-acetylmuramate--alanine ligase